MSLWYDTLDASIHTPAFDREREGQAPLRNFLLEFVDLGNFAASDLELEVLELVGLLGQTSLNLFANLDALVDIGGNLFEISHAEPAASHRRGANTESAGGKRALVAGDAVLVAGNVDLLQHSLDTSSVKVELAEVEENHVRVSAVGNKLVAELLELALQCLGVGNDLLLVGLEFRGGSLLQSHCQGSDSVVVGTALVARKDGEVDGVLEVIQRLLPGLGVSGADALSEEDHGATRATERLMRRRRDDIGIEERRWDDLSGNKAGDVSNVDHEVGANGIGDFAHALVVDKAAVRRRAGNQDLGAEEKGVPRKLIVVDDAGVEVDTVGHGLEVS